MSRTSWIPGLAIALLLGVLVAARPHVGSVPVVITPAPSFFPTQATSLATVASSPSPAPAEPSALVTPTLQPEVVFPIADFSSRITKKQFGTYVTPTSSPVQPERFTGFHTGVDVEYGDVSADVPVVAAATGTVTMAQWVSGYGGLLVIQATVQGQDLYLLYGHLRASSLPAVGGTVFKGQQVGVLGTAYSEETDGERRHLHFAMYKGDPVDVRGYVQSKAELSAWQDPLLMLF